MEFKVNEEFVACMLEISSEIGCILDEGVTPENLEILEYINNRLVELLDEIRKEIANERVSAMPGMRGVFR